jgi:hypothetical protein
MLLEQCAALAFGHTTPDAELHTVVQRICATLEDHRAMPADDRGLSLRGTPNEQFIGVAGATAGFGNPGNAGLGLRTMD